MKGRAHSQWFVWGAMGLSGFFLIACGYRLGETKSALVTAHGTLAVPMFINESFTPGAETVFTAAAREVFAREGGFTLVDGKDAGWRLEGKILSLEEPIETLRMAEKGERAGTYEMTGRVELALYDSGGLKKWGVRMTDRLDYMGSGQIQAVRDNRHEALKRLARRMMARGYKELAEGF